MDGPPSKTELGSWPRPRSWPELQPRPLLLNLVVTFKESFYGEWLQASPQQARSGAGLTTSQGQGRRNPEGEIPGGPTILPIAGIGWPLTHHGEFINPLCGLILNHLNVQHILLTSMVQ